MRGPIALVGSGEYLPQMESTDRILLEHVGGGAARVVILATAAGLEPPASPQRWTRMGVEHFARLGALATPVRILVRDDAFDPHWLPLLEAADFIYFSGGSPQHVIQTLDGSPAWRVIRARHDAGAVLAGCSAGAMAFGALTVQPRALWRRGDGGGSGAPVWSPALGVLGRAIVLPHFDRMASRMGRESLALLAAAVPAGLTLIGVDEDTALVRVCDGNGSPSDGSRRWHVMGRQGVSIFTADGQVRHAAGNSVMLDLDGVEPD